jgi:hypothetical protein
VVTLPVEVNGKTLVTMSLLEVYNATAYLLTDMEMAADTPVAMYTREGIGSVLALAVVAPPPAAPPGSPAFAALVGQELPYGVAVENTAVVKLDSRMPHRVEGARTLQEIMDEAQKLQEEGGG